MRYALFFDIDGTLVSFETHEIPASTILALTQAKANGCHVYIATGRPINIITNLGQIEHLIDGYVTTNGARCFVGNETVRLCAIPEEEARYVVADAQEKNYGLIVVGESDLAVYDPKGDVDRIFTQQLAVRNLELARTIDEVLRQPVLQLTPFFPETYEGELMDRLPGCISGRWHPEFTDITAREADKGQGLLALAAHEGIDRRYTIAFGDGGNDTTMIRTAAIGIAMGNAIDALKREADYVTTSVDDNGILNALRHYGIV
ncbi:MAG: Cof-type HAD-IIB family hydrolase [Prevotella sp.]|nr:Cof-type HAD-IIB family hydrolase [Prevotella sp.]